MEEVDQVEEDTLLVEVVAVVQAILNVPTRVALRQIVVLAGVVQQLARKQTAYFVIMMDIHAQRCLVHQVEVEAVVVVQVVLNVQKKMALLPMIVLAGVVWHLARYQTAYFVNMQIILVPVHHQVVPIVLLVVQTKQQLSVHNVPTEMAHLQIRVRVGAVRWNVQHQTG